MITHNENDELALARYAVIAPLVCRELSKEAFIAECHRVASTMHRFPRGAMKRVSRRNLRRWVKWYKEGRPLNDGRQVLPGLATLRSLVRDDCGVSKRLPAQLIERAIRLRAEEPSRTTATLVALLQAESAARGEESPVSREHTLARHLRLRRATRKVMRQERRTYPRFEHAHRNDLWQGDMMGGLCSMLFVDNGPAYQHRQLDRMAARLGIQVVFATPYHPQGKGMTAYCTSF